MYFKNRAEAGRKLAEEMKHLSSENIVIVALNKGAVIVGAQLAMSLHSDLLMLLTEKITLPGELDPLVVVRQDGGITYNHKFSTGEIDEYVNEFRGFIEEQKLTKLHALNRLLLGRKGPVDRKMLARHVVILVSDGMHNSLALDAAMDYLKPINTKRIIIATPIADIPSVDRMHVLADEIVCLSVIDNYFDTNHYYDDNNIPPVRDLFKVVDKISLGWKQPKDAKTKQKRSKSRHKKAKRKRKKTKS